MTPEATGRSLLTCLDDEHPEWRPLLVLIEEALHEAERPQWARFVPALTHQRRGGQPLLDGAVINVARRPIGRWIRRVMAVAAAAGARVESLAKAVTVGRLDPLLFFEIGMSRDLDRLDEVARALKDDGGVVRGLAPLVAMPMLQACRRARAER